ncbi:MAG: 1-hydroxycarotenoid 3,4-desaturase CrtD [Pseudomonadota bacterium]
MSLSAKKIIIIGAGMGGLAAAIRLTAAGLDVMVVEAQAEPGGKMRAQPTQAGPVDAGPTVLTMRAVFDDLFEAAGTSLDDWVTLRRAPLLARHFWPDGSTLDLFNDSDRSAEAVAAFAGPRAAAQFRAFDARTSRLFDGFDGPIMQAPAPGLGELALHVAARPRLLAALGRPGATMTDLLTQSFDDPRLRQLFGRYATYVGGSPYAAPALLALIWQAESAGVWAVDGGMHRLAVAMADLAARLGASIQYGAKVLRIEQQSGRIAAIHLSDQTRITADYVVFNGDPRALAEGFLGDAPRQAVEPRASEPRSLSANVWSFAATPSGAELAHHNVFFGADPRTEFDPISRGLLPEDPTLYVCAQDRAGGATPNDQERFEIIMNAPPLPGGAPEDTEACRTRTFPILKARGLRFSPEPPDSALTTPLGFDTLFPGSQGSLYGRSPHGMLAAFARPTAKTSLTGLYLAGGGTHPGAGVPMAALSGRHAAAAILTDLASTSRFRRTATPGGMSTRSARMVPAPSRSSLS